MKAIYVSLFLAFALLSTLPLKAHRVESKSTTIEFCNANSMTVENAQVYPNPFTEMFFIRTRLEIGEISLLSPDGEEVGLIWHTVDHGAMVEVKESKPGEHTLTINFANGKFEIRSIMRM